MTLPLKRYVGTDYLEADAAFVRAVDAGMTAARALVVANVASFRDCWAARRKIMLYARTSLSTVQRALNQAAELGLIGKARAKLGERLPGLPEPQTCGYSHRWTIGRGMAAGAAMAAIAAARVAKIVNRAFNAPKKPPKREPVILQPKPPRPEQRAQRRFSAAELDAALAELPPEPPPELDAEPPAHEGVTDQLTPSVDTPAPPDPEPPPD